MNTRTNKYADNLTSAILGEAHKWAGEFVNRQQSGKRDWQGTSTSAHKKRLSRLAKHFKRANK